MFYQKIFLFHMLILIEMMHDIFIQIVLRLHI